MKSPAQVDVYTSGLPTRPYTDVGIIKGQQESVYSTDDMTTILAKMRAEAANMGCDGLILLGSANKIVGGNDVVTTLEGYTASCIVYTDKPTIKKVTKQPHKKEVPDNLPEGFTPFMYEQLANEFAKNDNKAKQCLQEAGWYEKATVAIETAADGSVKNWGCREDGLKYQPVCKCILEPFIGDRKYWPTAKGFAFVHIYQPPQKPVVKPEVIKPEVLPEGVTEYMWEHLEGQFAAGAQNAMTCIEKTTDVAPVLISISINGEGHVVKQSCTAGTVLEAATCDCIVSFVVKDKSFWPTPSGFTFKYKYEWK